MTEQLDAVVALLRDVLGGALVGAYLHGSAVLGGTRRTSDLDVLAVVDRPLTGDQRVQLLGRVLDISGRRARVTPGRPVELVIVEHSSVRPWRYPPEMAFLYGEWLRADYEAGVVPTSGPAPDLAPLLAMVLQGGVAVAGPPPALVLDPVPVADLRAAIVAGIPALLGDLEHDTRNVVLTLARIWMTLATGELRRKDAAADWVLARTPPEHRAVLEHARAIYLDEVPETWDATLRQRVAPHVDHVLARISELQPPPDPTG